MDVDELEQALSAAHGPMIARFALAFISGGEAIGGPASAVGS